MCWILIMDIEFLETISRVSMCPRHLPRHLLTSHPSSEIVLRDLKPIMRSHARTDRDCGL